MFPTERMGVKCGIRPASGAGPFGFFGSGTEISLIGMDANEF